jgi:hypothetical protein
LNFSPNEETLKTCQTTSPSLHLTATGGVDPADIGAEAPG